MKTLAAVALVITVTPILTANAQQRSTLCQVTEETAAGTSIQRIVGCGEGFADNVLWHLDRADSRNGALDGRTFATATGEGVVVYVVDLAIYKDHSEFERAGGSIIIAERRIDSVPPHCTPAARTCSVFHSHGTGVASMIGGKTTGIAPGVRIVSIVAGPGAYREALRAIVDHAHSAGAPPFRTAVVNISGGYTPGFTEYAELREDVRRMVSGVDTNMNPDPNGKRFVLVVAAGNAAAVPGQVSGCSENGEVISYPGIFGPSIDGLITVGGITRDNEVWSRSCGGPLVEVLAPAAQVLLASGTGVDHFSDPDLVEGTSFATPYVAGMAARILEREPDLTPAEVEARIKGSPSFVSGLPVPVMPAALKRRAVR